VSFASDQTLEDGRYPGLRQPSFLTEKHNPYMCLWAVPEEDHRIISAENPRLLSRFRIGRLDRYGVDGSPIVIQVAATSSFPSAEGNCAAS
jgi:hypothetical protein